MGPLWISFSIGSLPEASFNNQDRFHPTLPASAKLLTDITNLEKTMLPENQGVAAMLNLPTIPADFLPDIPQQSDAQENGDLQQLD